MENKVWYDDDDDDRVLVFSVEVQSGGGAGNSAGWIVPLLSIVLVKSLRATGTLHK